PGTFAVVAEQDEEVVAFVLVSRRRRLLGHIITIDVHPEFRRRGIGAHLMEMAEQRLRKEGATRVVLEVATHNQPALAFYGARGFVQQRVLPRYYRDGSDAYLMEKAL
ncbi:MAG TPA: GNAT family N-acetyltransferase, partial [Terriglobia bacterium]